MSKFSQGPWTLEYIDGAAHLCDAKGRSLMHNETYYPSVLEIDEDWNLIAAAPDMYEALKAAEWAGNRGERVCPVCRRLDFEKHRQDCLLANALAKADGQPSETEHHPNAQDQSAR